MENSTPTPPGVLLSFFAKIGICGNWERVENRSETCQSGKFRIDKVDKFASRRIFSGFQWKTFDSGTVCCV